MAFNAEIEIKKLTKDLKAAQGESSSLRNRILHLEAKQKVLISVISNEIDKHHKGVAKEISQEMKQQELLIKRDVLFEMRREIKKSK